jgi:hypothetical protein
MCTARSRKIGVALAIVLIVALAHADLGDP